MSLVVFQLEELLLLLLLLKCPDRTKTRGVLYLDESGVLKFVSYLNFQKICLLELNLHTSEIKSNS